MKKTLLAILATVAMVACSNDEIVREAAPEAIGFDNAFIDNATRSKFDPSLTVSTLNDFAVYGYVQKDANSAVLFDGIRVYKNGVNWIYIKGIRLTIYAATPRSQKSGDFGYNAVPIGRLSLLDSRPSFTPAEASRL